jgi:hypothetical protein
VQVNIRGVRVILVGRCVVPLSHIRNMRYVISSCRRRHVVWNGAFHRRVYLSLFGKRGRGISDFSWCLFGRSVVDGSVDIVEGLNLNVLNVLTLRRSTFSANTRLCV